MSSPAIVRFVTAPIPSSDTMIYQTPNDNTALITQLVLCNTHSGIVDINIAITNSSATSSTASNRIFSAFSLSPNETMMVATNLPILENEKIWASSSVNNVVNLVASGIVAEESDLQRLFTALIPSSETVAYQVPANENGSLMQFIFCNTHNSAVTLNVSLTESSATSPDIADRIYSMFSIGANETVMLMTNLPIFENEKIWTSASVNNVVNFIASGMLIEEVEI
jgi:hypothetical protein